jgi:predicted DNA binding CopG/RHH family protein
MRAHYDFSKMKSRKNPYINKLKRQITIRIGTGTLDYFRKMASETGVPYQNLIDSYLSDCASAQKKLHMKWA